MKLNRLVIFSFIAIALIPAMVGMLYISDQSSQHTRKQYEIHVETMSQAAKQHVLTSVHRIRDISQLVASRTQLRISLDRCNSTKSPEAKSKITKIIADARKGMPNIRNITIHDARGNAIASSGVVSVLSRRNEHQVDDNGDALEMISNEGEPLMLHQKRLVLEDKHVG